MSSIAQVRLSADAPLPTYMRNIKSGHFNVAVSASQQIDDFVSRQVQLNDRANSESMSYALRVNENISNFIYGCYSSGKNQKKGGSVDVYV